MIAITYSATDSSLAQQILDDLRDRGIDVLTEGVAGQGHVLIALLSPQGLVDRAVWRMIEDALDQGQQLLPVLAQPVKLPDMIAHLQPLDFSEHYDWDVLQARLETMLAPNAPRAMRVLTKRTRAANRRTGLALTVIAAIMFAAAIYMIAVLGLRMPSEEYDQIDTQVALTRDFLIGPTMEYLSTILPRGTEQAEGFRATLDAVPDRLQPFVAGTATAIHDQLAQFQSGSVDSAETTPIPKPSGG